MINNDTKWGIVYCPNHNSFRPHKRWERIARALRDNGVDYDYVQSESAGSVDRLVKLFINNGYKTIIIVGGDSALNDAVNALMQYDLELRNEIVLGVIPNGMMNDFAHFWQLDEDNPEQTVRWLCERRVRRIDLGCLRYENQRGERCRRYFLNCVNIGLIASIMNLRRTTHHLFGSRPLSFFFSFLMMTFQRLDYKMKLRINSDTIDRRVMTVCIGNCLGYGQTPNAVPYNGLLDVSVMYHPQVTQLFEGIYLFMRGKILNHRSVHPYRTREVDVVKAEKALVAVDGRLMNTPRGPFAATVEKEVINFLIPT